MIRAFLGCLIGTVLLASTAWAGEATKPFIGVGIQLNDPKATDDYIKAIDRAKADGADSVLLALRVFQENGDSVGIFIDALHTVSFDHLGQIIAHAKKLGMRVAVSQILTVANPISDEWHGTIRPRDVHAWFENYRAALRSFAEVAQANHADLLVIGCELVSMQQHTKEWLDTISMVRDVFHGQLTYQANWDNFSHKEMQPVWEKLDLIGMNSFWTLGANRDVTSDEIAQNWDKVKAWVFTYADRLHKPVILLEVGWCSLANAAKDPWDYTQTQLPADPELQKKLYEAFYRAWIACHRSDGMGGHVQVC